jgi:hypothetical protein
VRFRIRLAQVPLFESHPHLTQRPWKKSTNFKNNIVPEQDPKFVLDWKERNKTRRGFRCNRVPVKDSGLTKRC